MASPWHRPESERSWLRLQSARDLRQAVEGALRHAFVPKPEKTPIIYKVGSEAYKFDGNFGRLLLFFNDNPTKAEELTFDVSATLLDTNDVELRESYVLRAAISTGGVDVDLTIEPQVSTSAAY